MLFGTNHERLRIYETCKLSRLYEPWRFWVLNSLDFAAKGGKGRNLGRQFTSLSSQRIASTKVSLDCETWIVRSLMRLKSSLGFSCLAIRAVLCEAKRWCKLTDLAAEVSSSVRFACCVLAGSFSLREHMGWRGERPFWHEYFVHGKRGCMVCLLCRGFGILWQWRRSFSHMWSMSGGGFCVVLNFEWASCSFGFDWGGFAVWAGSHFPNLVDFQGLECRRMVMNVWLLQSISFGCEGLGHWVSCAIDSSAALPVLRVGEERKRESLAFFDGSSCEYEVQGLQERRWYEIKISYPACVCPFSPLTRCVERV